MMRISFQICARGAFRRLASAAFALAAVLATPAGATSFIIDKLFSTQSGDFQYIQLRENSMSGMPTPLAGSVITVRYGANDELSKRFVIPTDAPATFPAGGTSIIATGAELYSYDDGSGSVPPDYVMPQRFLPTDGGTIDLDGQDPWTFASLPIDGGTALLRSGAATTANGRTFVGRNFYITGGFTPVIEYYNKTLDQYFITASEPDIDAIESGRFPGWEYTGELIPAYTGPRPACCTPNTTPVPVCRFDVPVPSGDSHFFSAAAQECDAVAATFPSFVLETSAAFYVALPDPVSGACPFALPVYRLWNPHTAAHRYVVNDLAKRAQMIDQGWVSEGFGPAGVAWCV